MQEELANEAIRYTLGRLQVSHCLAEFPHHIPPCHNLHKDLKLDDEEGIAEATHLFKPFPYLCSFPMPISPATKLPRKVLNGVDPVTTLVREKMKWEARKKKILKANKKGKRYINNTLLKTALSNMNSTTLLPNGITLLAEHLKADPDPQYSGTYNWYYSGGNLTTWSHLEDTYLISTNVLKPGVLSFARLSEEENVLEMVNSGQSFTLDSNKSGTFEPVLGIITDNERIGIRQKNQIHILKPVVEDGHVKINTVHSIQSKQSFNEGFVSLALESHSEGNYCALSNCGILRLYQLDKSEKCISSVKTQTGDEIVVSDRWGSIHYSDPNTLLFANRCCIHLLDQRCGLEETQLTWCPKNKCEYCEEISVCTPSTVRGHVQYVATNHQALTLDVRSGFSQRWTHLMHNPPYIGLTTALNASCEMLLLGGQSQNSLSSIINTWEGNVSRSCNLPFNLTSPAEALESVRCRGSCLDPILLARCNLSLTGLTNITKQNSIYILRSNSVGDVFCQHLVDRRRFKILPSAEVEYFSKWEALSEIEPVSVTSIEDFGDIFENINNWSTSPLTWSQSKLSHFEPEGEDWRVSKGYLEDCVDLLAAPLLSVWELDDEPEWERVKENIEDEPDPADKVLNWLGSGSGTPTPQDTSQLAEPLSQVETTEKNVSNTINLNNFSLSELESTLFPLPASSKRSAPSDASFSSVKKISLSQTVAEQIGNTQSQRSMPTPKKKFVTGF